MLLPKRKRTLSVDPMAVVSRFVDAANRHDAEGVEACLHPDFESIQPTHPDRNFKGSRQVRRNWQAIFQAEPGFRLTVLRSSVTDDTAWVELHGAGEAAEVAGVLVFGVESGRLRWSRIYSEMVEQSALATDGSAEPPPPPAATIPSTDPARPVFEVIQGEGGGSAETAAETAAENASAEEATAPEQTAEAAGPEAVEDEEASGEPAVTGAGAGNASTETLVGSEWAPPIEPPDSGAVGDESPAAPAPAVETETVAVAPSEVEVDADKDDPATGQGNGGSPPAKPAGSRRRKPRATAGSTEAKPRRSRKKPTE